MLEESEGVVTFVSEKLDVPTDILLLVEAGELPKELWKAKRDLTYSINGLRKLILEIQDMRTWFGYGKDAETFYTRHLNYVTSALNTELLRCSHARTIIRFIQRGKTLEEAISLLPPK